MTTTSTITPSATPPISAAAEFIAKGYNVAHVVCDTAGDPAQAARAYNVVIDRFGAKVIVGPDTSDEVFAVAKEVKARGVPMISPSATNPDITKLDDDSLVWRTAASDNLQSKVLATLPPSTAKVDIVYVGDSSYASGLQAAFVSNFPGHRVAVAAVPRRQHGGMNAAVAMVSSDMPTYALLIADFDAPPLMAAVANSAGLSMTQFLMTDSAKKPSLWGQLGGNYTVMTRVRGTGPANPDFADPSGKAFAVMQTELQEPVRRRRPGRDRVRRQRLRRVLRGRLRRALAARRTSATARASWQILHASRTT